MSLMPETDVLQKFNADMRRIVQLLEHGDEVQARSVFNSEVFPNYKDVKSTDVTNPLSRGILFFYELDEYLNNPAMKILRVNRRKDIIGAYYSEFDQGSEKPQKGK